MAETTNIVLESRSDTAGKIEIAPEVIEIILGIAANDVDGVYQMRGNLSSNINEWLGRTNHSKGVTLTQQDGKLMADVYVYLDYGVSVPKVALKMQETLKQQLLEMTDLTLSQVNVHVVGVVPQKSSSNIDPDDLFADANETTDQAKNSKDEVQK
ncbi:MAG: Asp23/Gls24 family envelope stress response protein [Candidatus Paralactobacillus gallistercoris]|uniref:Asp23/Gls24 family envelope stress response protein n=1 Tax=Candidatus Paralactobacillus gallistercoris TaxID=2838724 RepID=A0A948TJZ0_9LACO|nr:Asp23/Gls24 family envelope stress response protein [Candidatus Paralactobacillus gallistercoris]